MRPNGWFRGPHYAHLVPLTTLTSPLLGATTTVLVGDDGTCVVVDPGGGVVPELREVVEREGWRPVALLATHGHADHTWSAAELCARWGVPLYVHEADAYRLDDPLGTLGPLGSQLLAMSGLPAPEPPGDVRTFAVAPGEAIDLDLGGGPSIRALHLPGHTEGSTVYLVDGTTMLAGDILFAGSVGRTDLPGGDMRAMTVTLDTLALMDPGWTVIPGHGPQTTLGAEQRTNPYLRALR